MRKTTVFGLAFALLGLLAAGPAAASDTKTYPGVFCAPTDSNTEARVSTTNGGVSATGDVMVACPVIKNVKGDPLLEDVTLNLKVAAGSVTCDLYAYRSPIPTPPAGYSWTNILAHVAKSTSGTGSKTMSFANFGAGLGAPWPAGSTDFSYYQVVCGLHTGDRIISYKVRESGNRDEYSKIYPSSMCRPDPANSSAKYFSIAGVGADLNLGYLSPGGWIQSGERFAGDTFAFVCPVITDHMGNQTGTASVTMAVNKPNTSKATLTCTFYASDTFAFPLDSTTKSVTGPGEWTTVPMNLDISASPQWARYHIYCQAPGTGDTKILGYRVQEN